MNSFGIDSSSAIYHLTSSFEMFIGTIRYLRREYLQQRHYSYPLGFLYIFDSKEHAQFLMASSIDLICYVDTL